MSDRKNILSPSILAADFAILGEQIKEADEAGAEYIHIDVMDGVFVPSISFGMPVITSIRKTTKKIFDVHLMIVEPERFVKEFAECGADSITFHIEATEDVLLVVTVEPGFGGQKYIPESTERIREIKRMADEQGLDLDIQVDGGITKENVQVVLDAGANVIVAGSAVFRGNIPENVKAIMAQF